MNYLRDEDIATTHRIKTEILLLISFYREKKKKDINKYTVEGQCTTVLYVQ